MGAEDAALRGSRRGLDVPGVEGGAVVRTPAGGVALRVAACDSGPYPSASGGRPCNAEANTAASSDSARAEKGLSGGEGSDVPRGVARRRWTLPPVCATRGATSPLPARSGSTPLTARPTQRFSTGRGCKEECEKATEGRGSPWLLRGWIPGGQRSVAAAVTQVPQCGFSGIACQSLLERRGTLQVWVTSSGLQWTRRPGAHGSVTPAGASA